MNATKSCLLGLLWLFTHVHQLGSATPDGFGQESAIRRIWAEDSDR